jgi:hypothetical protein
MKTRIGLIGSIVLGVAIVGLSGNLALAVPDNGNIPGASNTNGCGPSGGQPQKCSTSVLGPASSNYVGPASSTPASVPEPSSMILLGAAVVGMGIWKRMSRKI